MSKSFLIIIVFSIFPIGCSRNTKSDKIEYIIYGVYAGECMHHCATMYKLTTTQLLIDTTDSYFNGDPRVKEPVKFNKDTLNKEQFIKAQIVKTQLPEILLTSDDKEFGYPDNHDQGGIFIQLKIDNGLKTFRIDTELDKVPTNLRNYATLIMKFDRFQNPVRTITTANK